jgi:hypothetical protein
MKKSDVGAHYNRAEAVLGRAANEDAISGNQIQIRCPINIDRCVPVLDKERLLVLAKIGDGRLKRD